MGVAEQYDVLVASDLRLPGGTTASIAEEVRAQAAAGYRTALLHVPSRLVGRTSGIDPRLRKCVDEGLADLLVPGQSVHTRLAVLRNATAFEQMPVNAPVSADRAALIANHVAVDAARVRHYHPAATDGVVAEWLGVRPVWHPIGPAVRASLAPDAGVIEIAPDDWRNLLDVDEWAVDRTRRPPGRRPVIGRHSRSSAAKWPESRADLLAAYPAEGEVVVRVLGGATAVADVLGEVPAGWIVERFGQRDPRDFLADIDYFVYFHRSDLVEGYGRTVMEAMASGAVVVLPEHFRESFGDAALYTTPQGVQPLIQRLAGDHAAYLEQSRKGQDFVRRTHGYPVHVDRLRAIIGPPSGAPVELRSRRRSRDRARVLFVSSNGAGMGHLTRLLAMATRADERVEPMFFSMSQAVSVVERYGFAWEYCPSRGDLDTSTAWWNQFFARRFVEILGRYRPSAVVFDGTMPYAGIVEARPQFPDTLFVWSRRGMWRETTTTQYLPRGEVFDLIVEPGEVAAAADRGPTAGRTDAVRVGPVTLIGPEDMVSRAEARAELGMEPDAPALLLSLGAGNINDITSDIDVFAAAAAELPGGWSVYATKPPIARAGGPRRDHVRPISVYPLAKYLNAFDAAVVAAGYNSYHEVLLAHLPAAFVPNLETITDDQMARATFAQEQGLGIAVPQVTPRSAADALAWLTDPERTARARAAAAEIYPGNGAGEAMALVENALAERGVLR